MKAQEMKVLITGATGGIGSRVATILAARGARVLLTARNEQRLQRIRDRLNQKGREVDIVPADLSSAEGRAQVVAAARGFAGGVNALINNAGVNHFGRFENQSSMEIESLIGTNLVAPVLLTHELLPLLRHQPAAVVMNVGSIVGSIGLPGQVAYASSKFALHGFSEALRRELRGSNVTVLYVAPRSTDTDMNDALMREINTHMGVATDDSAVVARCVADAMGHGRRERFIGWPERLFVKLNALLPGLVDRSLQKQTDLLNDLQSGANAQTVLDGVK